MSQFFSLRGGHHFFFVPCFALKEFAPLSLSFLPSGGQYIKKERKIRLTNERVKGGEKGHHRTTETVTDSLFFFSAQKRWGFLRGQKDDKK